MHRIVLRIIMTFFFFNISFLDSFLGEHAFEVYVSISLHCHLDKTKRQALVQCV